MFQSKISLFLFLSGWGFDCVQEFLDLRFNYIQEIELGLVDWPGFVGFYAFVYWIKYDCDRG